MSWIIYRVGGSWHATPEQDVHVRFFNGKMLVKVTGDSAGFEAIDRASDGVHFYEECDSLVAAEMRVDDLLMDEDTESKTEQEKP